MLQWCGVLGASGFNGILAQTSYPWHSSFRYHSASLS